MAFQQVPDTVQIAVVYTSAGEEFINTFHAEQSGGYNQAGIDALAAAVDSNAVPGLLADLSIEVEYLRTDVRGLSAENDITATANTNSGSGGNANIPLPPNVAFCIQRSSGLTGRNARGRVYVGGIPRAFLNISAGEYDELHPTFATAYQGHIDGFRIAIDNVGTFDPVIVSRYHENTKRETAVTFAWTTTKYTTLKLATVRKRLGR